MSRTAACLLTLWLAASAIADEAAEKELQSTVDAYVASYNAGSVDEVMSFWTEDADFVDIRGNFHKGRDLIAALFRRGFADNPDRTIAMKLDERKFLTPSVAMDDGILDLTASDGRVARGRYAVVWIKTDGKWRIRSARDIPLESIDDGQESEEPDTSPLDDLQWLIGKWEAKSGEDRIELECRKLLDDKFLVQNFQIESDGEVFQVVTYITYDPAQQCFRSWYFDSRGGFGGGPWSLFENHWRIEIVSVLPEGVLGACWMAWEQADPDTLIWRAVDRHVGGELLPDAEQSYVRVKQQ